MTKNGWNSLHLFLRYGVQTAFGSLPAWTLIFDYLTPTSNQHIYPNTLVTKNEWNSLHWFLRYGVHEVFGKHRLMHALTHWWTDPNTQCLQHHLSTVAEAQISTSATNYHASSYASAVLAVVILSVSLSVCHMCALLRGAQTMHAVISGNKTQM